MSANTFVIAEHTTTDGVHWDLMLEYAGVLWTWRLEIAPGQIHGPITTERIFDHPLKFLTYEGPVQNNTGSVTIADKGALRFGQIDDEIIMFELDGKILHGLYTLQLKEAPLWILTKTDR